MSKVITINDINSTKFYQLPKAFFHNPFYQNMKNETKIAYSLLRDLLELSITNNWINENNEVYVKLSREKLMKYLNIKGTQKITQIMNELKNKDLIVEKQLGLKKCNEIYICIPDELDKIYSDEELLEHEKNNTDNKDDKNDCSEIIENTLTFENQKSGDLKIKSQEIRKSKVKTFENQIHTKTKLTKTNTTNLLVVEEVTQLFEENICKLKKTTKEQFLKYCDEYNIDFIKAIISLCAEINTESFAGFKVIINGYINKGIVTKETLETYVAEYRAESKKIREKERQKRKDRANNSSFKTGTNEKNSTFNNFPQREYDFDALEKKLLGWDE